MRGRRSQFKIIQQFPLGQLEEFKNHPFRVVEDEAFFALLDSIQKEGILEPLVVRKRKGQEKHEIISGHRRKKVCERLGIENVPVIECVMSDDAAVIAMVDSNLKREVILPSEKAFAYKMKLEAMKHQGKADLSSGQRAPIEVHVTSEGEMLLENAPTSTSRSDEILARQVGESRATVQRYIRLTYLIPKLLEMVDQKQMALSIAEGISYLREAEQYELLDFMEYWDCTPSLSQVTKMKQLSKKKQLDTFGFCRILEEEKPNQKPTLRIKSSELQNYFPDHFTDRQKVDLIKKLLQEWSEQHISDTKQVV